MHNHDYTAAASLIIHDDGTATVTLYPIQGPDSVITLNLNQTNMPITKEEIQQELHSIHQEANATHRRIFALMLKVQNVAEDQPTGTPFRTPHPDDGVLKDGHTTQPPIHYPGQDPDTRWVKEVFIPQLQVVKTAPTAEEVVESALGAAKGTLRTALENAGLGHLSGIVDKVSVEDLKKVNQSTSAQATPLQPTPVDVAQPSTAAAEDEVAKQALLGAFIGRGSIFTKYLDEKTVFGGFGLLGSGAGLKRFKEDALWVDEASLREWPTGLYCNRDTKVAQLMVSTDQLVVVVDGLPSEVAPVHVLFFGTKTGFKPLQDYNLAEQALIHAKLDMTLMELVKKNH